ISSILQKQINRETDYAFRYGGEEFLLMLGFTDSLGANIVASRINKALHEAKLPHCKSPINQYITVSMGIATISDKECTFLELLDKSDKALYVAKESGRNTIIHSRPEKVMS
ncbi:MAG: GGDEF domain-containing protein, partial [Spirochaetales bacterium]|nr:GGDEF domain-containing protein [Spirochaetales bacterium]